MKRRHLITLPLAALASSALAHGSQPHHASGAPAAKEQKPWGVAGDARNAKRTVSIRMDDSMRFTPAHIEVREGETLRLRVTNRGKLMHELVIGTQETLDEHAALMKQFPDMEHDEPYMAHVAAGRRGELVWTFNRAGDFRIACLIPGHYDAGMVGTIRVLPTRKT